MRRGELREVEKEEVQESQPPKQVFHFDLILRIFFQTLVEPHSPTLAVECVQAIKKCITLMQLGASGNGSPSI